MNIPEGAHWVNTSTNELYEWVDEEWKFVMELDPLLVQAMHDSATKGETE